MPRHLLSSSLVALVLCLRLEGAAAAAPPSSSGPVWSVDDELVRM